MTKYIDADVVITSLTNLRDQYAEIVQGYITYDNIVRAGIVEGILSVLREYPAADVVEVRHGRWNELPYSYECSVCGIVRPKEMTGKWHYCPNCGASMRGEEK